MSFILHTQILMTKKSKIDHYTDKEALDFHNKGKSGKIEISIKTCYGRKGCFI